jgi:hypothetical protein
MTQSDPVTTTKNPLIRACLGCKDPDLQYVHLQCINKYITTLVMMRHPTLELETHVPFLSAEAMQGIQQSESSGEYHPLVLNHQPPCVGTMMGCSCPQYERLDALKLHCSRCMDSYNVLTRPVSSLRVLMHDRIMRVLVGLMTLCILILIVASMTIILVSHKDKNNRPIFIETWWNSTPMDVRVWASLLMGAFVLTYTITVAVVLYYSSGYREVLVLPKSPAVTAARQETDMV